MKVSYAVAIEEIKRAANGRMSEEAKMIQEFLKGNQPNMCFEYDSSDEAKERAGTVSGICKRINKEGEKITYSKRNNKIYVMKVA